jgi:predicted membrane protein
MVAGLVIIGVGLVLLLGVLLRVDVWLYCWPTGLIVLGCWLLLRPTLAGPNTRVRFFPLGDLRRTEAWDVADEEIWIGVGDVHLDLSAASLPVGESTIKVFGLVGDLDLVVPEGTAVSVSSYAILTDGTAYGERQEKYFAPVRVESKGYSSAEARVRVVSTFAVTELKIERPSCQEIA